MLVLSHRLNGFIYIYPSEDMLADLIVAELSAEGGIEVTILETHKGKMSAIGWKPPI